MTAVTGTFTDPAGDAAVGYVRFQPRTIRESILNGAGNIVTATRITVPLDGYGAAVADLEPGDYNISVVLQGSRTFYGVITVPDSDVSVDLRELLSAYMPYPAESTSTFGLVGDFEWQIPYWVNSIDYVIRASGGGGGSPVLILTGQGGMYGAKATGTLIRGTHFKTTLGVIAGTVGAPGGGGHNAGYGNNGAASTLVYTDINGDEQTITVLGGAGGGPGATHNPSNPNPHSAGAGAPEITYLDKSYGGGSDVSYGKPGSVPGGGGGGGILLGVGGPGGVGKTWLVGRRASS